MDDSGDCDDTDPGVHPGAPERCDGVDNDCDGLVAEALCGTIPLSSADAKLLGEERNDRAGWSVSSAGDVDGDGFDDVLVGAYNQDENGPDAGAVYLVLGGP